jgi:flagellar motor switch protein FliG
MPDTAIDINNLTPRQKAAQMVVALGADVASSLYKHLEEDEIELLTYEITRMSAVPPAVADQVIDEFYGLCVAQKVYIEGGVTYAKNVLEKAFGVQQGNALLERVTKTLRTKAFEFIRKADYKNLMNMIVNLNLLFLLIYWKLGV